MSPARILVFGRTGQVGSALSALDGCGAQITALGRAEADLINPSACIAAIKTHHPDAVINAAAYTSVDAAETDRDTARVINAAAPAAMARFCAAQGIPFVTISTDYVFSGKGTKPWTPTDLPDPQNTYGRTKREGEVAVASAGGRYAILRTSWVVSAHGRNFITTMVTLGASRDALAVVSDQIGAPTAAANIAQACVTIAKTLVSEPEKSGIYHLSGTPHTTWADVARMVFSHASITCDVQDIPTRDYPTAAARPLNSRLDCTTTRAAFGISQADWRVSVAGIIDQLNDKNEVISA
ncbi:dTDP-4-dehydrorhamnose reductase [Litoreibacter albidus]|uniref:dTDP-4-dehydrorhamnose reductase n=1 Tax=Litoreibacter albidus TaxID=670155 RepID=A0A1H3CSQ5_9RHOB|nr:dTDP-4-dehydrorhamnose reductase [Litoreibacter albidus]SDX57201.1 dTDP-4-dehydrorhamnose reductase [Litoreibacter albidus]